MYIHHKLHLYQCIDIQELHSSRTHTARLLTGGGLSLPGGVCLARGGLLARGSALPGGGFLVRGGGLPCQRGGLPCRGGGGVGWVSQHALRQTPPVNRITHTCKNITLPQLRCGR